MAYKNFDEVDKLIFRERCLLRLLQDDLSEISSEMVHNFFSLGREERVKFKEYKEETKRQIKNLKNKIKYKTDYLDSVCRFKFDDAMKFITEVMSIVEGEKYKYACIQLEEEYTYTTIMSAGKTVVPVVRTGYRYDDVCLISTERNVDLVLNSHSKYILSDRSEVENLIDKGIILDQTKTYTLFDYNNKCFSDDLFSDYPYLSDIVRDLIDLRISQPQLSVKDAMKQILHGISDKYSNLISGRSRIKK